MYRNVREGWQGEFGAMRIPDEHSFTFELIDQLNLTLDEFRNLDAESYYHILGTTINTKRIRENLEFYQKEFDFAPNEMGKTPRQLYNMV